MRKVLIADGTEGFRNQLRDILCARHAVTCAADGAQAWAIIQQSQPDLLIMDLELSEIDGITLLRRMQNAGLRPAVIVITRMFTDYTVDTLIQMQVGYLLRKPCKVQNAAERAEELLHYRELEVSPVRAAIADLLREFGIPAGLHGSRYLLSAIVLMAENPSQYITKELYPSVGREYGQSGNVVERAIRNAIEKGWDYGNQSAWEQHFGKNNGGWKKRPNNAEFIAKMVELLKIKLQ